jgi:D-glycero-alpha-D-manno-heptose 1-phosphate guanylyltransferase
MAARENPLQEMKSVLLVGGLGTRLRTVVSSAPKVLARVGNRPFLELLIRQLRYQGAHRLVLCTGYLAEQIEEEFGDGREFGVTIQYSRESQPMGTAGAVKRAKPFLESGGDFLVLNGDSFVEADFERLVGFHREHRALASLAALAVPDASRYGTVQVGSAGRVTGFAEKGKSGPGLVNAGVYVFREEILEHIPEGPASLEKDVFPRLLDRGVYAREQQGMFVDIGTPEDYARAQAICEQLRHAALGERKPPVGAAATLENR